MSIFTIKETSAVDKHINGGHTLVVREQPYRLDEKSVVSLGLPHTDIGVGWDMMAVCPKCNIGAVTADIHGVRRAVKRYRQFDMCVEDRSAQIPPDEEPLLNLAVTAMGQIAEGKTVQITRDQIPYLQTLFNRQGIKISIPDDDIEIDPTHSPDIAPLLQNFLSQNKYTKDYVSGLGNQPTSTPDSYQVKPVKFLTEIALREHTIPVVPPTTFETLHPTSYDRSYGFSNSALPLRDGERAVVKLVDLSPALPRSPLIESISGFTSSARRLLLEGLGAVPVKGQKENIQEPLRNERFGLINTRQKVTTVEF